MWKAGKPNESKGGSNNKEHKRRASISNGDIHCNSSCIEKNGGTDVSSSWLGQKSTTTSTGTCRRRYSTGHGIFKQIQLKSKLVAQGAEGRKTSKTSSASTLSSSSSTIVSSSSSSHDQVQDQQQQQQQQQKSKQEPTQTPPLSLVRLSDSSLSSATPPSTQNPSETTKKKSKSDKKTKVPSISFDSVCQAMASLKVCLDRSRIPPEAEKALRDLETNLEQVREQVKLLLVHNDRQKCGRGKRKGRASSRTQMESPLMLPLQVQYTLHVDDPTRNSIPWPDRHVALARATYPANDPSEDRSTVVVGDNFVLAGVWDGHGGTHAADFCQERLFQNFQSYYNSQTANSSNNVIVQAMRHAFLQTDKDYYDHARHVNTPQVFFAGTCAIACHVNLCTGVVTCANLGDSRAVMGVRHAENAGQPATPQNKSNELQQEQQHRHIQGQYKTVPLSVDHTADSPAEQARLREVHPDDFTILVDMDDTGEDPDWRVKKLAAFTRSIGDLHLKEKNAAALFNSYANRDQRILPRPGVRSKVTGQIKPRYISNEPEIKQETVQDGFLIIACDGVWDEMSSEEAVNLVAWLLSKHDPEETDIAKLFIEETLKRAVHRITSLFEEEEHLTLRELKSRPCGKANDSDRSYLHDDITVVILFFGKTERTVQKASGGSLRTKVPSKSNDLWTGKGALGEVEGINKPEDEDDMNSFLDHSLTGRPRARRESSARHMSTDWTALVRVHHQVDAARGETDQQIIKMMTAFDKMDEENLKLLFQAVDLDGNGTLDREEIAHLINKVIQMNVTPAVLDLAFSEMDADGSGDIDVNEFVHFFGK